MTVSCHSYCWLCCLHCICRNVHRSAFTYSRWIWRRAE